MPNPPPKREAGKVSASLDPTPSLTALQDLVDERDCAEWTLKQQALELLEQGQVPKSALAEALGVSRQTVYNWIKEAKK